MENEKILTLYELIYWKAHIHEDYDRPNVMVEIFNNLEKHKVVADIGCGPLCGLFHKLSFNKMYAVDPLWDEYDKRMFSRIPNNVIRINSKAQDFVLDEKADLIVSFNAIDHSGDLNKSIVNIMNNLDINGRFCLHVHMRTKSQLNEGHRMLITEKMLDDIFSKYVIIKKNICPDPFSNKYNSYIAEVKHRDGKRV